MKSANNRILQCILPTLLICAVVLTWTGPLASCTHAATVSFGPSAWSFSLSPGSTTVNLSQFDPSLGTLISVELFLSGTEQADVTAENDGVSGGSMSANLSGSLQGKGPGAIAPIVTLLMSTSGGPVSVAGTDGTPGSGPDFHDFGTLSDSQSDSTSTTSNLPTYTGLGTVAFQISGSGGFSVSGVSDSTIHVTNFGASGEASVVYTYTPVPEPASIVLAAVGLLGIAALRRRRSLNSN